MKLFNFLSKKGKPSIKRLIVLGSGAGGTVYDFANDKVLKVSKGKFFRDSVILNDLKGISTFPVIFNFSDDWYIAEKFVGESIADSSTLKDDWMEVFLEDVKNAFERGWEIQDLKIDNLIVVDGYVKMFDVGMFLRSEPSGLEDCLYWTKTFLENLIPSVK